LIPTVALGPKVPEGGRGPGANAANGEQRAARGKQEGQRQQRRQPDAAALAKSNSYVVRVVNKDGQPEPRTIKVGLNNGSNVEVLEGLKEGELVVVGEVTAGEKSSSSNQRGPMGPMMGGPRR